MKKISIIILIMISLFNGGCSPTSKISTIDNTREDLRDIFLLTILARDYLRNTARDYPRNTERRDFNLQKLMEYDSLGRISKNFESIKQIFRGGHIAIQYKFSKRRDYKIEFTENEKQIKEIWRVIEKKNVSDFDGEIQFEYGERFYKFRKIIIEKP